MEMPHRSSKRANRFKSAALGLGVTLAPVAALACVQFLLASQTVLSVRGVDPMIETWAVSSFRSALAKAYSVVTALIIAYWLFVAMLSRGQFLKVRSANIAFALSGITFGIAMVIASAIPTPEKLFKGACPVLSLPDVHTTFGFDGQSSCEAFSNVAVPIALLGMPLILLATSAILRVVVSRRR